MNEPEAEKQSREAVFVGFLVLGISTLTKVSYNYVFPFLSFIDLGSFGSQKSFLLALKCIFKNLSFYRVVVK